MKSKSSSTLGNLFEKVTLKQGICLPGKMKTIPQGQGPSESWRRALGGLHNAQQVLLSQDCKV